MPSQQTNPDNEAKATPRSNRVHNVRRTDTAPLRTTMVNLYDEFKPLIIRPMVLESQSSAGNEGQFKIFEDPKITKVFHEKYMHIRIVLGFLLALNSMLSLIICEQNRMAYNHVSNNMLTLSFVCTALQMVIVILWPLSVYFNGLLKREKLLLSNSIGIFAYYGLGKFFFMILLLFAHPFYIFLDMDFPVAETFYTKYRTFEEFHRPVAEYLIIIQITVAVGHVIFILIEMCKMGNTRSDRIARFFSIEADETYIVRTTMQRQPFMLCIFMYALGLIFFSTLYRITENCFPAKIYIETGEFNFDKAIFVDYSSSFWLVIITMATIGYGDLWIGSTLSRAVIILAGLSGIFLTSIFVLISLNVLKMSKMEEIACELTRNTPLRIAKDKVANNLIYQLMCTCLSKIKDNDKKRIKHKSILFKNFDSFKVEIDNYRISCDSKDEYVGAKAFQIKHKIDKMYKTAVPVERSKKLTNKNFFKRQQENCQHTVSATAINMPSGVQINSEKVLNNE